jgi:ComF family protein
MLYWLLNILFPSPCFSCGLLGRALCSECMERIKLNPHVRKIEGLDVYCSLYYESDSILNQLIIPFKYKHHANLFRLFVPPMRQVLKLLTDLEDIVLVPVPLHPKRELKRGYNQSELLARWVGSALGLPVMNCLARTRDTRHQAHLALKHERFTNMQGAFRAIRPPPKKCHILLVDDIVTTGSTLLACRSALFEAGAERVSALTLANRDQVPTHPWD